MARRVKPAAADADAIEAALRAQPAANMVPAPHETVRAIEAMLYAAAEPLSEADLAERLPLGADVGGALATLMETYAGRGVELARVAGRWRFQTAADLSHLFEATRAAPKRLPRAALETLAVIAYHQPVTRAEIEEVRGVSLSRGSLDLLLEVGWVRPRGRRRTPGRPVTYGTTDAFLSHFGLSSLDALPGKDDLKAAGVLDARLPAGFETPRPSAELSADEDPLENEAFFVDHMRDPAD